MINSPIGYTHTYTVQTYDLSRRRTMTVAALVRMMQEAAMQNVIRLNLSAWDLEEYHISWVLLRKSLKINRMPRADEQIKIMTYPTGFEKVFTYRDYKVTGSDGEILACSSSAWLLMDTRTRRMVKIPDFIFQLDRHTPPPENCLPRPEARIAPPTSTDMQLSFRVDWHDLDFNGHLNNVYYLQWMIETLPDDVLENGDLQAFEIQYKAEGYWKDTLACHTQKMGNGHYAHRLIRVGDHKELALGESHWK